MSDVFISYKQERRAHAERLAVILAAHGYDTWWDYRLVPGDRFRTTIEQELNAARAVVVLWCKDAIESNFVIDEADHARKSNKLLQITIEQIEPPLGFRSLEHRLNLVNWPGNADHELIDQLLLPVARLVGREPRRPRDLIRALAMSLTSLPSITPIIGNDDSSGLDLVGGATMDKAPKDTPPESEFDKAFFQACKTADDFEAYIKKFPDGIFGDVARSRLRLLDSDWISALGITPEDWSLLYRDDLLERLGPRASRAELEPRARRGSPEAQTLLALLASQAGDTEEAMRLYYQASETGFPRAQLGVGALLQDGRGAQKDKTESLKWLRRASAQGNAVAQYLLYRGLSSGRGSSASKKIEGADWLRKSAQQGFPQAQFELAYAFEVGGPGFVKDPVRALEWCRRAATAGIAAAQNYLARMLQAGIGTAVDLSEAAQWYKKAAEQGFMWSQYNYAQMLNAGTGVPENPALAFEWFLSAAEAGHTSAQFECGRMLEDGRGTAQDLSRALHWYTRAAKDVAAAHDAIERLTT